MPHFFGFIPKESAADEKRAVRVAAAEAVRALTEAGAAEGWASAAGKPRPLEMSLSYTVRQTVYFAKEGTRCKLPADPASPTSEEASGCRAEVLVRSRDITKGEHPGESGFEPVPAWIDPAQPEAWRVRTVTISSFDGTGQVLLDAAAQEKIAARAKGLLYFYGIDAKDRPFVGENGRILHFVKAAGARSEPHRQHGRGLWRSASAALALALPREVPPLPEGSPEGRGARRRGARAESLRDPEQAAFPRAHSQRRAADALEGLPGLHGAARHGLLLPGLLRKVVGRAPRARAHR
jgi:uncharacterized protein (DUF779 family)